MKKKLTINSLAVGNITKRRKFYVTLIISVICAMMFSSGMMFFAASFFNSLREHNYSTLGKEDYLLVNTDLKSCEECKQEGIFTDYGTAHLIGYAYTDEETVEKGSSIGWLDAKAREISYQTVKEGRLPEKDGEIAVEENTLLSLGFTNASIGDKLKLNVLLPDGNNFGETPSEKEYTLTGILKDKKKELNTRYISSYTESFHRYLPSIFVCENTFPDAGGKELYTCYAQTTQKNKKDPEIYNKLHETYKFQAIDSDRDIYTINSLFPDRAAPDGNYINMLILTVTLAFTLTVISCLGIINAFQSNLRERRAQIGMLRAVGATRRQIVTIFGREALLISVICAPISVLLSYFGVKLVVHFLGEEYVFLPNIPVLLVSTAFGIICVMLAALIPLRSASKISPMQCIRNIDVNRKMYRRKIRTQKQFSCPKLIAKRNLTFYKGKRIAVTMFLVLTILISCFGFSFAKQSLDNILVSTYDYRLSIMRVSLLSAYINMSETENGYNDNDLYELLSDPLVEKVSGSQSCRINIFTDKQSDYEDLIRFYGTGSMPEVQSNITKDNYRQFIKDNPSCDYNTVKNQLKTSKDFISSVMLTSDSDLLTMLKDDVVEGTINIEKINSGEEIILIAPQKLGIHIDDFDPSHLYFLVDIGEREDVDYWGFAENPFHAGDTVNLKYVHSLTSEDAANGIFDEQIDRTVTIGAVLYKLPYDYSVQSGAFFGAGVSDFQIISTHEGLSHFTNKEKYDNISMYLKDDADEETDKHMQSLMEAVCAGNPDSHIFSNYDFIREQKEDIRLTLIIIISVMLLFFTISAGVINSTVTSQIRENKREIGTLRAVGAGLKELSESYTRQLLSLFLWGYGIGFGSYIIINLIINIVLKALEINTYLPFTIWQTLLFGSAVFAVCAVNLRIQLKKQMKNSIVDNIREL